MVRHVPLSFAASPKPSFPVVAVLLLTVILAAWIPSVRPYVTILDDHEIFGPVIERDGAAGFLSFFYQQEGTRRILGHFLCALLLWPGSHSPAVVFLLSHWVTSVLFWRLLFEQSRTVGLSLACAVLFAVLPIGLEAVVWNSAHTFVFGTAAFLWLLIVLYVGRPHQWRSFPLAWLAVFFASIAQVLTTEALLFATMFAGLPLILTPLRPLPQILGEPRKLILGLTPFAVAIVAGVAAKLTQSAQAIKTVRFAPRALLSPVWHQKSGLNMYTILADGDAHVLAAGSLGTGHLLVIAGALAVFLFCGRTLWRTPDANPPRRPSRSLLGWVTLGLITAGWIYVLAGGYALDSRKRYCFLPFLAGLGFLLLSRLPRTLQSWTRPLMAAAIAASAAATFLWCAYFYAAAQRDQVIRRTIARLERQNLCGEIHIQSQPPLSNPWLPKVLDVDYSPVRRVGGSSPCLAMPRQVLDLRYRGAEWMAPQP